MMANFVIVTNNKRVADKYSAEYEVEYHDVKYIDVLTIIRDKIHSGHKLLTHPLSGSVKPNETPFKSILITKQKKSLDAESLRIIEESIVTCRKFGKSKFAVMTDEILDDFSAIDCSLIDNAMASAIAQ